ncbi:MAG TPA: SIR2 family protein [Noviherbaspirillum sp.]|nr:SIR2 family protein [Noviherbaspirillum sp.]
MIPDQLVREFSKENGTVFVGAGLSMGARLPSWAELVDRLRQEVSGLGPGESYPPTQIAQFFENEWGRGHLINRLREELESEEGNIAPTQAHDVLVNLPVQRIFTTNFDRLLEKAIENNCGYECSPVMDDRDLASLNAKQKQVIKIHGGLRAPESIIVTTDDYNDFIVKKPAIAGLLKAELQIRTVLFLGYSFSDYNLQMIASQAGREIGKLRRNVFILQFGPSRPVIKDFERHGFIVIPLENSDTNEGRAEIMRSWLEEFRQEVMDSSPGLPRRSKNNLPPRPENFVGRGADLERVLSALQSRFPVVTILGKSGIGKTSLAIEAGNTFTVDANKSAQATQMFDYVVWVSGRDKPMGQSWFSEVLDTIAMTAGFPVITQTPSTKMEQKKAEVNLLLRNFKILLIIDNFDRIDAPELTAWIQEIPGSSKVLVTAQQTYAHPIGMSVYLDRLEPDDGIKLLGRHAGSIGLKLEHDSDDDGLRQLVEATDRNPQLMKLALGVVNDLSAVEDLASVLRNDPACATLDGKFEMLLNISWNKLEYAAQNILLATPLFPRMRAIRKDALAALSGLGPEAIEFSKGLAQCERNSLLEQQNDSAVVLGENGKRYTVHSTVRQFAERKLDENAISAAQYHRRFSEYFLGFVRTHVIRPKPDVRYWNALVSKQMLEVDPEWPSIQVAMKYAEEAGQEETLAEFVLLLAHYMDCRFYNAERLAYVQKAIGILNSLNRKHDEALLCIDALGWTYMEENQLEKADETIRSGMEIVKRASGGPDWDDLRALGLAWQARIWLERSPDPDKARELIRAARDIKCRPWIGSRVLMVAGDIELKWGEKNAALQLYRKSAGEAKKYQGEGEYQLFSRIGLAYLENNNTESAKRTFSRLLETSSSHCIEIGKLYAQYGLATIASKDDESASAVAYITSIRNELLKRERPHHLLLKMVNKLYDERHERRTGERRLHSSYQPGSMPFERRQ